MNKRVIIAAGGTAGHIYPAISLARSLRDFGFEVIFIGSDRLEKNLIPAEKFEFRNIEIKPIRNLRSIWVMVKATISSFFFIKRKKVDFLIGFGNYISVPPLIAGFLLGKDIYIHEQNIKVGLANRLLAVLSTKIFLTYDVTLKYLKLYKSLILFKITLFF